MKEHHRGRRVTVFVSEQATWHHRPLYAEIVHRAHRARLAGATVLRGFEGFGASHRVHTSRILSLSGGLPVAVLIVDTAEAIDAFLPQLDEILERGTITIDDVDVIHYTPGGHDAPGRRTPGGPASGGEGS
ncbi:DUF190 domain-containing protein [Wenjunlia tyrosinilytica]|uniref:UPF0166 protein n=1 Tax=Wenjunlia tyrosinilytica TaxID=1544741 RepID=A0A917ZKA5_9ACTN|nr:DUF190 domain-containing protein [Wenjunlia tyrosinilytica]GGO85134.1 UPF0166 protein [Wenjunlia tyrosinilytica]